MPSSISNTSDLRKMLIDVISDVRAGNIDYRDAGAVCSLTSQVLKSAKLDFDVKQAGLGPVEPAVLLNHVEGAIEEPSPLITSRAKTNAPTLSEEKRTRILDLKANNKPLHVICDAVRASSPAEKNLSPQYFMTNQTAMSHEHSSSRIDLLVVDGVLEVASSDLPFLWQQTNSSL